MTTEITLESIKELRYNRMRLGQAAADIHEVPSMPELRFALVPITEADYLMALDVAARVNAENNPAGMLARDRIINSEILAISIRQPGDLEKRVFSTGDEVRQALDVLDVNFLFDMYMEMISKSSPSMEGFTEEQIAEVKKVLVQIDWNDLSGSQWWQLRRFLSSLSPEQLQGRLVGFSSTNRSTTTSDEGESIETA